VVDEDLNIVLVSNRGPVSFVASNDHFDMKRGAGGLAGALHPVARKLRDRAVWIATATSETDRRALAAGAADGLATKLGYPVYLLDIEPEIYSSYYDDVSNRMLWFANHCLWEELGIEGFEPGEIAAWEDAYELVNRRYAEAVAELADPSALVLFQDYHLTTAPRHLRQRAPNQTIFHFTHSSFCCPGLKHLPEPIPRRVLEGMLAADLVGFHTRAWAESFLDCCESLGASVDRDGGSIEHSDHRTWVRSYPIPIDVKGVKKRATGARARRWTERLLPEGGMRLIVRGDRAEPSKNVVRGFEAFGLLLDRRPDLRQKVQFLACLYPSRESMPEYREYLQRIEATVEDVNARHADAIRLFLKDDYDRTLAALSMYDVLLVNSIMDGMNLVSKEGPVVNDREGVLVLSSAVGSVEELGDHAVTIADPLDVNQTAEALGRALDMDAAERGRRAQALRAKIETRSPADWIQDQLDDLLALKEIGEPKRSL
jgi:trehalose 6-phosphate synthase